MPGDGALRKGLYITVSLIFYQGATIGGKGTKTKGATLSVLMVLVAYAFAGLVPADTSSETDIELNSYEKYMAFRNELDSSGSASTIPEGVSPDPFSYLDGPYLIPNDDGSIPGESPLSGQCWPYGSCYVSSDMSRPPQYMGVYQGSAIKAAGNMIVWEAHESLYGDQNGNGYLEWVVLFAYLPWMGDGIDNDGDGCVDEVGEWSPGACNNNTIPDAATVYETGGRPIIGGDNGDLLLNVDWYSYEPAVKLFRAFVSPRFHAYAVRGTYMNPQISGEYISYYSHEMYNGVNSNPEMDTDFADYYVGSIDARYFPTRSPVDRACSAGVMVDPFATYRRDDGFVVTGYELVEGYDGKDWNGDGDMNDHVSAYYATGPRTGNCRDNAVNTGVSGSSPRSSGVLLMPGYTYETGDGRDWDQDGNMFEYMQLYHEINTTWTMKGPIYTSYTFTASVPSWGFGWWGLFSSYYQFQTFPLEFGGAYHRYLAYPQNYKSFFFLTSDEDGDRHTILPEYSIGYGIPLGTAGGSCVVIQAREYYLNYAGVKLMHNMADGNGDYDTYDSLNQIFCPDQSGGGGSFVVEPSSKFANGLYVDPMPFIWEGFGYYDMYESVGGVVTIPSYSYEMYKGEDCNGDMILDDICLQTYRIYV